MDPVKREAWLKRRQEGVTATDIARIVEGKAFEVYLEKIGVMPPLGDNERMYWGRVLEPVVAEEYARRTGRELINPSIEELPFRHPDHPWVLASPDRLVKGESILVQCKTGDSDRDSTGRQVWGEEGTDQIPAGYVVQTTWEAFTCAPLNIIAVDVPVLFRGNDFRIYTVPRSNELIAHLFRIGRDFWARVGRREPPPLDYRHPEAVRLLNLLAPPKAEVSVSLDESALVDADLYLGLGAQASETEKDREAAKARLIARMGEAGRATLPDGREITRKIVNVKAQVRAESQQVRFHISKGDPR